MAMFLVGGKDGLGSQILAPGDIGHVRFERGRMLVGFKTADGEPIRFRDTRSGKMSSALPCPTHVESVDRPYEADVESEGARVEFVASLIGCCTDMLVGHRMIEPHVWELVFGTRP